MPVQLIFGRQTLQNDQWPLTFLTGLMGSSSQHDPEPMVVGGSFTNWKITRTVAPGSGVILTWTLYKNGVATSAVITISGASDTEGTYTGTVSYAAGDTIHCQAGRNLLDTVAVTRSTIEWIPDDGVSNIYGWGGQASAGADGLCVAISGNAGFSAAGAFAHSGLIGADGTITAQRSKVRTAPGAGKSRVFTLVKNGVDQDGSGGTPDTRATIADANVAATASFSLTVAAGDTLAIRQLGVNTPASITWSSGTIAYTPDDPDVFITSLTGAGADTSGVVRYAWPNDHVNIWDGTTATARHFIGGHSSSVYVQGIRAEISLAAGASKSWTFTLYVNGVATDATVTIAGASDTTGSTAVSPAIEIAPGDEWTIGASAVGTPASTTADNRVALGVGTVQPPGLCSGGGEIDVVADPADGETFVGRTISPRAWLTLAYDDADRSFALDSYNHVPAFSNGRKGGILTNIGTVTRQLSDRFASYKMADCTVDVDDTARLLSTLEAAAATEHWANREAQLYLASPTTIAAAGTPHTLFRGIWRGHDSAGLERTLTFTDRLGSEFSDFNLEDTIPRRLITRELLVAWGFTQIPIDVLGRVIPIAYGRLSDQETVTTEIGTVLPYDGTLPQASNVAARDINGPPGTLNGAISVYVMGVKNGAMGPLSKQAGTHHYSPHSIQVGWNHNPTFDSYVIYFYFSKWWLDWTPYGGVKPGATVPWVRMLTHDNSTLDGYGDHDMSVTLNNEGEGFDALNGVAFETVDTGTGLVGLDRYLGIRTIGGVDYHGFLVSGHADQDFHEIYVDGIAQNIADDEGPWLIPGFPAYDAALNTDGWEVVTVNGVSQTLTAIYGRTGFHGPDRGAGIVTDSDAGVDPNNPNPTAPLAVNFCAIDDVGDRSGNVITLAPRICFHLLDKWVIQNYQTGTWPAAGTSDDGVPWLNSQSFSELETIEARWMGGEGYEWRLYLDEPVTVRELLAQLLENSGIRFGQNQHGQVIGRHLNDATDLSTVRVITDHAEIVEDTSIRRKVDELENKVVYDAKWRHATRQFDVEEAEVHDDTAIAANRNRTVIGDRRLFKFIGDETTALDVARRALEYGKYPPRYADITCTLHSIDVQLGDIVSFTDVHGIGATGWANRALWVLGIQTAINNLEPTSPPTITFSTVDVHRFMTSKVVYPLTGQVTFTGLALRSDFIAVPAGDLEWSGLAPTVLVA